MDKGDYCTYFIGFLYHLLDRASQTEKVGPEKGDA